MTGHCVYCGRVAHRCHCADEDSPLHLFLASGVPPVEYAPCFRKLSYKRGVPPQIKRAERARLRSRYQDFFKALVGMYGATCQHCGNTENLVIDHVISIARGGRSELENLQLLCAECNRLKGKLVYDCRPLTS